MESKELYPIIFTVLQTFGNTTYKNSITLKRIKYEMRLGEPNRPIGEPNRPMITSPKEVEPIFRVGP